MRCSPKSLTEVPISKVPSGLERVLPSGLGLSCKCQRSFSAWPDPAFLGPTLFHRGTVVCTDVTVREGQAQGQLLLCK